MVASSDWCHVVDAEPLALAHMKTRLYLHYTQEVCIASTLLIMNSGDYHCFKMT